MEGIPRGVEHPPLMNESANCCIHWAKIKLFGYGPNYRIELSELKPNVNLNMKFNTLKSQVVRSHYTTITIR